MFFAVGVVVSDRALNLVPHADGGAASALTIVATLVGDADALVVRYTLSAALDTLRVPPPAPAPARRDGLWQHTCFELFVADADGPYHEFNFSPAGDWQAYRFAAYRRQGGPQPDAAPRIDVMRGPTGLTLEACVPRAALPSRPAKASLTAVIEDATGALSYWALRHPPGRPDFHHSAGFTVDL